MVGVIKSFALKAWKFKTGNADKYKKIKIFALAFFPVLLACTTESNHMRSVGELFGRILNNFNAFIFSVIILSFCFFGIVFITSSATFGVFINWVAFFTFSWVEYFKFVASGTHFVVTDMAMIGNASDMTKFTTVNIRLIFNLNLFIMLAYTVFVFFLHVEIKYKLKNIFIGLAFIGVLAGFIAVPAFSVKVYSVMDMENSESINSFTDNDKFDNMNFIPYFVESATSLFTYAVKEPENYSEELVKDIIKPPDAQTAGKKPQQVNVVYILSESFADFRIFESENQNGELDPVYANFDAMRREGFAGICAVPTFGGYTSRAEFEIMFGLPLKSIGSPAMPSNKMKHESPANIAAIPGFYKKNGYDTTYIHPFSKTFYNRDDIYPKYGFENMIFDDSIKARLPGGQADYFRKYISDRAVFECIIEKIKSSKGPDYIVATTMQNHVPYSGPEFDASEYEYYLDGIKQTDVALGYFKRQLEGMDELCMVVFVGDHFPFFISANNKYDELGIDSKNCDILYEQKYFVWANFDFDKSELERHEKISLFYLPGIIAKTQGLKKTEIINTVLGELDNSPVYTKFSEEEIEKNEILDILTYDLIMGEKYALK